MAGPLTSLLSFLAPPPPISAEFYEGTEYRWKVFVFRPAEFKYEIYMLAALLAYVALYFIGKSRNAKYATTWINAHLALFGQQFSRPTIEGMVQDGNSDFFNFSTGRRNIASLHTTFTLIPRHDPLQLLYLFGRSLIELDFAPKDQLELDFTLFSTMNVPGFVWGIVAKEELSKAKEGRWDLTFTRTSENSAVGSSVSVMAEFADVTETLLKLPSTAALIKALNDPACRPYFRSLSITDQRRTRPALPVGADREKHVILSLRVPPPSQAEVTNQLVQAIFVFIDSLDGKVTLRPETRSKLKKTRDELDATLQKEAEAEKKEEAELEKAAAKKKAEDERISKLSAADQRKALERERKRSMKKVQGKMMKK